MAGKQANPLSSEAHPLPITHKSFLLSQIIVRSIAAITSLSATILMVTDKQSISLFGLPITAKYTYAPAFRFFTASNSIAFAYSVLSLTYLLLKKAQGSGQKIGFFVFLLDLIMVVVVMAGSSGATAMAWLGKYGNPHTGWLPICGTFKSFCFRAAFSLSLSYVSFFALFLLILLSRNKNTQ
ncbi:CASP-like protein 1F1 isoform X1 [Amborella trichopoda]|uniref:CASP-like protein n=1 Tax=Amborella trichopoda TaxID=13333 RepID=W1PE47_AMBTC|nr:CASP-like protein 1F1 isoform X1 [Amborella trichopoda]ERN06223.1 hypothetical protein AMTR_s00016p00176090 [Amborella trichopoda]|eukprot:XP_020523067.1 CASP-like protein 1F1 isoform X1 [Amborella trichopoda]